MTQFVELAKRYADITELDQNLVYRLIDRIEIGESYKKSGIKYQAIDIFSDLLVKLQSGLLEHKRPF